VSRPDDVDDDHADREPDLESVEDAKEVLEEALGAAAEPDVEDLPTITVADRTGPHGPENVARCAECPTVLYPGDVSRGDVVECKGCHTPLVVGAVREVPR
jgi:hypothetical protein